MRQFFFLLICLFFVSCADEPEDEKPTPATTTKLIGRVSSVYPEAKFVLIESYQKKTPVEGEKLNSLGEDRQAALSVTGEKSGHYIAADIERGEVKVSDAVYRTIVNKTEKKEKEEQEEEEEEEKTEQEEEPEAGEEAE